MKMNCLYFTPQRFANLISKDKRKTGCLRPAGAKPIKLFGEINLLAF
jgi:hypothetical protein